MGAGRWGAHSLWGLNEENRADSAQHPHKMSAMSMKPGEGQPCADVQAAEGARLVTRVPGGREAFGSTLSLNYRGMDPNRPSVA